MGSNIYLLSLCKKTPNTALFSFLKRSFTISKLLGFKNFESLVFDAFLSKTQKFRVFLLTLLKVHGTDAEADYLQIRDGNMSLIGYIRCTPPYQGLKRLFEDKKIIAKISNTIGKLPYGKLTKFEL